jgi:hypothetical protein
MLPTDYQNYIHLSRYSRWRDDLLKRETWEETVQRYFDFFRKRIQSKEQDRDFINTKLNAVQDFVLDLKVMPSMRCMMTAGKALDESNVAGYNCAFVAINHPHTFDEICYILMCGTGVGFSVEKQYTSMLPVVAPKMYATPTTIVVEDSKIGWATAFRELLALLWTGKVPKWDLSRLRPAGARLVTFGGRSSGPAPLDELFKFAVALFKGAVGRKFTTLECHDLVCMIGCIVVTGGVRRSALISLSDMEDMRMRDCKSGEWWNGTGWRRLANNSAVYSEKPPIGVFMEEWIALYKSKSGERGIFNHAANVKQVLKNGRRKIQYSDKRDIHFGTNPCSEIILRPKEFCVAGDTPLITGTGLKNIKDCVGVDTNIWNGNKWSKVKPRITGYNQELLHIEFSDGSFLDCTPEHNFSVKNRFQQNWRKCEAQNLLQEKYILQLEPTTITGNNYGYHQVDNSYTLGVCVGDGCIYDNEIILDLYGEKVDLPVDGIRYQEKTKYKSNVRYQRVKADVNIKQLQDLKTNNEALNKLFCWNKDSVLNFVAGWADADGTQVSGGIRLYISNEIRARKLQLLLTANGIKCSVNLMSEKGEITNFGPRSDDMWYLQITKCNEIPCHRLDTTNGHEPKFKGKYQTVRAITKLEGLHTTYCFDEPENHKGLFANVLTYQCNLSEVVIRSDDTYETVARKVEYAAILGTIQSTLTDFSYISDEWKDNCEEERLLGVSMTGIMDHPFFSGQDKDWLKTSVATIKLPDALTTLKQIVIDTNVKWSQILGIAPSVAVTCVKPSGTVSQLVNAASGIHPRYSRYYIRRVRADKKDPVSKLMRDAGVPVEDDITSPEKTDIFSFPMLSPETAILRDEISALDQLKLAAIYQKSWCEHKPSITIYVRENEWLDVGAYVYKTFDDMSGVSFLPYDTGTYRQAPYEEITEEKYREVLAAMPKNIDWSKITKYETEDQTTNMKELACVAGVCEL